MDQERKEEIIKLYGEPFMQTKSGGVKLNKLCLSELFNASVVIRYIKPVGFFEEYLPTTKVWHKLDNDDDINHRIMTMIIAIVPEQIRMLVYTLLAPAVLSDIATLFRYKVGVDTLPLPPGPSSICASACWFLTTQQRSFDLSSFHRITTVAT